MSALRDWLHAERAAASASAHGSKVRTMLAIDRREPDLLFAAMVSNPEIIRVYEPEPFLFFRYYPWLLRPHAPDRRLLIKYA